MADIEKIKAGLLTLKPENADQWTADGLPKVDALGIPGLKRADITAVAPQFTRENPTLEIKAPEEDANPEEGAEDESEESNPEEHEASDDEEASDEEGDEEVQVTSNDPVKVAAEEVARLEKLQNDVSRDLDKARHAYDALVDAQAKEQGYRTSQHDIMDYIASQRKLREERGARHRAVMNSGFDLSAVGPAPIDRAMARNTGRGGQRPNRTPTKGKSE